MRPIRPDQAYVAIDNSGFVEGACFTQSEDADRWVVEMKTAGMRIELRDRAEARRILFTHTKESKGVLKV